MTWPKCIEKAITEIGLRGLFLIQSQTAYIDVFQRMKDIFHQESFSEIKTDNSKLRTYSKFKDTTGYENYLNEIKNLQERTSFTRLRLSNHELMIEKGRHQRLERQQRICPFCPNFNEDEIHFLLICPGYKTIRTKLFSEIGEKLPNFDDLQNNQKFLYLMANHNLASITAKYVLKMMELRKALVIYLASMQKFSTENT